jgi:hypothetical protein
MSEAGREALLRGLREFDAASKDHLVIRASLTSP